MINRKIFAVVVILALSISLAAADEKRNHKFPVSGISLLSLNIREGTIVIEHAESDFADIELRFTEDEDVWFK